MAKLQKCPWCETTGYVKYLPTISTWTTARYACKNCKKGIEIKTLAGKATEVSVLILTAVAIVKLMNDPTDIDISDFENLIQ